MIDSPIAQGHAYVMWISINQNNKHPQMVTVDEQLSG